VLRKLRFIASISLLYMFTIGTIAGILQSSRFFAPSVAAEQAVIHYPKVAQKPIVISGKPIRINIDGTGIDLPLVDGSYDANTDSWTLSETAAQFAAISSPANNQQGTTFIYGHGTAAVFGAISEQHPPLGTVAHVSTDTSRTFNYVLADVHDYTPTDTSLLDDLLSGPPRLVVQTCSGALSQWRTMFIFQYKDVQ
jgi:hypothetical protein